MKMLNIFIAIIILSSCQPRTIYESAYLFIIENESSDLLKYLQDESGDKNIDKLNIFTSKEIASIESMFFDNQVDDLKEWAVFSEVKDVRAYLWEYNSRQKPSARILNLEISHKNISDCNLIMFFSEVYENLLLVDVIYLPPSFNGDVSYEKITEFGRSFRFLLEVDSQKKILNCASTFVHHN